MQFHLDGFTTGDPAVQPASDAVPSGDDLPAEVDILIVGCGPAGLTLAAQLAAFPDIVTRIVEEKAGPLRLGQADGVACRTMEMFAAFGFSDRVLKESYWVNETAFWQPDGDGIVRRGRIQDTEDGLSEFPHVIINQARIHDFYLDVMRQSASRLEPHYGRRLRDLAVEPALAHPVTVRLERVDSGAVETVRARYVVGCDGARSAVRKSLNLPLRGDAANRAWGVMDILAVTDFPDIRLKSTIRSAAGSMLIIPREGGYLVRCYVELDELAVNERIGDRTVVVDDLLAVARRIFAPYTLDVKEVAWWSVYEIGQRLCDTFDDVPVGAAATRTPHVFIAGDACHTHSPKAGQGMNVSMQDAFNLGWKLAAVIREQAAPALLHTYSAERRAVAAELIDFDRQFAEMFSSMKSSAASDQGAFEDYFVKQGRFTAGTATRYGPSMITGATAHHQLATGFTTGMRFHSAPVIRLADARPLELGHIIAADGRWRLFVFADAADPQPSSSPVHRLCAWLADSAQSPLRRGRPGSDIDALIDVRAVFQQRADDLAIERMPSLLLPRKGRFGLYDYEKMFVADRRPDRDIFDLRGIDRARGCMVVVRPDQYVAAVLPLDAVDALAAFFAGVSGDPR